MFTDHNFGGGGVNDSSSFNKKLSVYGTVKDEAEILVTFSPGVVTLMYVSRVGTVAAGWSGLESYICGVSTIEALSFEQFEHSILASSDAFWGTWPVATSSCRVE